MKVIKCDLCGKTTADYIQVKYRTIKDGRPSEVKKIDVCTTCHREKLQGLE